MISKKLNSFLIKIFFLTGICQAQSYNYTADLAHIKNDKVQVTLLPPDNVKGISTFFIPKFVPGTYAIYDFGRFVSDFSVLDKSGAEISFERPDANTWKFDAGQGVAKISYWVEDTWDTEIKGPHVFEPGGSSFEEGKNFFLNNHCLFGYFDGLRNIPFEVTFTKPDGFFGATVLEPVSINYQKDSFKAASYFELVDSPVMYSLPDTSVFKIGGAEVMFAIYSPSQTITAKDCAGEVRAVLEAQKEYLGGSLPVKRYAFIMYMFKGFSLTGSYGALEHNNCSMYYLPEGDIEGLSSTLFDFCSHEFFHIVTPLNIHSEQIQDFDFMNPVMSRHLWLYEGVTEYSAGHVQVKYGLITFEDYVSLLQDKIISASGFDDTLPFTEMSLGALEKHKDQYMNVYAKGSLIGMCLDVLLRKKSDGLYGIQNLMKDLSKEYGKEKPFPDEQLFSIIEKLTFPEIGEFLRKHVGGNEPLPLEEIFSEVGIEYHEVGYEKAFSLGGVDFLENTKGEIYIGGVEGIDEFGKAIGYQEGDILVSLGEKKINARNFTLVFLGYMLSHEEGDEFIVEVKRRSGKKKYKTTMLQTTYQMVMQEIPYQMKTMEVASPEQLKVRKDWLGDYKTSGE